MGKFIFSGSSYVLGYRLSIDAVSELTGYFHEKGVRFASFDSIDEIETAYKKIKYFCGAFVNCDSQEELESISAIINAPDYTIHVGTQGDISGVDKHTIIYDSFIEDIELKVLTDDLLKSLVPDRLDELAIYSANFIFPSLFPTMSAEFIAATNLDFDEYDYLIMCDISDELFKGRAWLKINVENIRNANTKINSLSDEMIIDNCREFVNQFLGIVNSNLLAIHYAPSVGLPSVFTKKEMLSIQTSGPYMSTVTLYDSLNIFQLKLGVVLSEEKKKIDLTNLDLKEPNSDVDFF